jgi:1-acyl-sn-glycerol-3-phosphate acyltransferase
MKDLKIFPSNEYITPHKVKNPLGDKLLFKSRWYFYIEILRSVAKYKPYALDGSYDRVMWANSSFEMLKLAESCGCRFNMIGLDNIRVNPDEPMVIVSNHMSTLETVVFPAIFASMRETTFVIKDSIMKNPIFKHIMGTRKPIVVSRVNPREDLKTVLKEGAERLKNGTSVIIFPQSTRTEKFKPSEFNSLAVKLARKAGVRLMPVAIKTDFWGNGKVSLLKEFGPLNRDRVSYMDFGEPFTIKGNGNEEHQIVIDFIEKRLKKWRNVSAG